MATASFDWSNEMRKTTPKLPPATVARVVGRHNGRWRLSSPVAVVAAILGLAVAVPTRASAAPSLAAATTSGSAIVTDVGCVAHSLARNDDSSTGSVALPFSVLFYGQRYTNLYVNNNGNVTFQGPLSTYTPYSITASTPPIIAAFFADIDTRPTNSGLTTYGTTTFAGRPAFCVNWRRVGYFSNHTNKLDNIQLLLVNTNASGDFDIVMNYGSIQWETGDASGGANGLGGTPAAVGFSNGDGSSSHFFELPGSLVSGAFLDGGSNALSTHSNTNPAVAGRFIYHISNGNSVSNANICNPYTFVSARGSGETSTGVDDNGNHQGGAKSDYEVYQAFNAQLTSIIGSQPGVTFYQLPYQALSVSVLGQGMPGGGEDQFFNHNLPQYEGSIDDGRTELLGYLDSVSRTCATQHRAAHFVLTGYSQGALVIHQVLEQLATTNSPILGQISGVGLIADPANTANSAIGINWGSAAASDYGVCQESYVLLTANLCGTESGAQRDIPSSVARRTEAVCDSGDVVCDTSTAWHRFLFSDVRAIKPEGMNIHSGYATNDSQQLGNMGKSLGRLAYNSQ